MPLLAAALLFAALIQSPTYTITGEVHDSEGKPAAGVVIRAANSDQPPHTQIRSAVSDISGRFVLKLNGPGKYNLVYDSREKGYVPQSIPFFRDPRYEPQQIVLTEAAPTAQVIMFMTKTGFLTGDAIDAQIGSPIERLDFRICHANNRAVCWSTSAKSATGNFSLPAPFVPFVLKISAPGFEDWFGLTGSDENAPIEVPAGTKIQLHLLMRRTAESSGKELSDLEKHVGVNLPAPKQISPDDNAVFEIYPRITKLEWEAVEGAASYAVELDVCESLMTRTRCVNPQPLRRTSNSYTANITGMSYEFSFVGAQPGRWRVWAVDKQGRDGFKSPWRTFVYMH
jgi:hypothetical protein